MRLVFRPHREIALADKDHRAFPQATADAGSWRRHAADRKQLVRGSNLPSALGPGKSDHARLPSPQEPAIVLTASRWSDVALFVWPGWSITPNE
jgi:hypothetical protein